jgi:transposase
MKRGRSAVTTVAAGKRRCKAAAAIGVNQRFVGKRVAAVARSGQTALSSGRRGRRPGEQKALGPSTEDRIKRLIIEHCPGQLELPFVPWTREAVAALIPCETGRRLSPTSLSTYLRSWCFTAQRPMKRATERREPAVRDWLDHKYPAVAACAKA